MEKSRTECVSVSDLQRELWSLCGPHHRVTVVGGLHCSVPLLRVAIMRHEITKALWESQVHSKSII